MLVRKRNKLVSGEFIAAAIWDVVLWTAIALVALSLIAYAKADCVVAFGASWCEPCRQMKPIEDKLRAEGVDIRYVDIDANPVLKRAYRVARVPTFVYVAETPTSNYECDRLVGLQTEQTLRQFCQPRVLLYDTQPVLNTVRWVLGFPVLLGY